MAESYSVKAVLSATDKGFTSTLKGCSNALNSLAQNTKGFIKGFGFGMIQGMGQAAFSALTNGVSELVDEMGDSNAAWKNFESNMKIIKGDSKETEKAIASTKKELQEFAQKTVYSSSDMASTFAQLEAVGVDSTLELVKGFGGLAAASENPQQAMKTLSQQATQMAAKPMVSWGDFKLMLEQTPAGIAAVAKSMGMSTAEMVTAVQEGEIATKDFFNAIVKAGTSDEFSQLATEAKTVDQAMDGLKETVGNKLMPTFNLLSQKAIGAVNGIADKLAGLDGEAIANKVAGWVEKASVWLAKAEPYWNSFVGFVKEGWAVLKTFGSYLAEHSDTISKALPWILKFAVAFKLFSIARSIVPGLGMFTKSIATLAGKGIGAIAGKLFGIAGAQKDVGTASVTSGTQMLTAAKSYALMGVAVLAIAAGFALLAMSAIALANSGGLAIGVMAGLVIGVAAMGVGMALLLKMLAPMGAQMMPVATAMLAMGAAVLLVSAGFALLTVSAISLANAGGPAIGIMVGMVAAIALLAVGAAALGPALTAGSIGFIAFGAAIALVGAGALLAAASLAIMAAVLPAIVAHGTQGATAITALSTSMLAFATGAVAVGASMLVLSASFLAFGASALTASAGMVAFAASMVGGAAGTAILLVALKGVSSQMKTISKSAKSAEKSLDSMNSSIDAVESGLDGLGSKAKSALKSIKSAFDDTASEAKSAGQKVGNNFAKSMQSGLKRAATNTLSTATAMNAVFNSASKNAKTSGTNLGNGFAQGMMGGMNSARAVASSTTSTVNTTLRSGRTGAYSAGAYVSAGFAAGMRSCLSEIRSAANSMAAAAEKAIRAKAKIASPSKVTTKLGAFYGEGFANGIADMTKSAWNAAAELVSIPQVATPQLAGAYGFELSSDYDYVRNSEYVIEVPLTVDGKEFARATASYTQAELNRNQTRENRKRGKV